MNPGYKKHIKVMLPFHIAEPLIQISNATNTHPATILIMLARALTAGRIKFSDLLTPPPPRVKKPRRQVRRAGKQ